MFQSKFSFCSKHMLYILSNNIINKKAPELLIKEAEERLNILGDVLMNAINFVITKQKNKIS